MVINLDIMKVGHGEWEISIVEEDRSAHKLNKLYNSYLWLRPNFWVSYQPSINPTLFIWDNAGKIFYSQKRTISRISKYYNISSSVGQKNGEPYHSLHNHCFRVLRSWLPLFLRKSSSTRTVLYVLGLSRTFCHK